MRIALLLFACSLAGPAFADDLDEEERRFEARAARNEVRQTAFLNRVVLSARLCVYQKALAMSLRRAFDGPERPSDFRRYISFTRRQLAELKLSSLSCRDRWVGGAIGCLGSWLGSENLPIECGLVPLSALRNTDASLDEAETPAVPEPAGPPSEGGMVCTPLPAHTGGGEQCKYVGPKAPSP